MNKIMHINLLTMGLLTAAVFAGVSGPYTPDADTLHLYHFDGNGDDAVSTGAIDLSLINGATATDSSAAGFNTALNTDDETTGDAPSAAAADDIPISNFVGDDGAFTFEAIIQPASAAGSQLNNMQIISGEGDGSYDRCWQFRINTDNQLQFLNLVYNWSSGLEDFHAAIPTTGEHAYAPGNWYHVAVTYTGQEDTANNLKLYWTKLNSSAVEARLLESFQMVNGITGYWEPEIDFAIGNEGRDTYGFSENFEGLIDEARISSVARQADDMLITEGVPGPVILSDPNDMAVNQMQSVFFKTVFASESTPSAAWYKVASPTDIFMDPAEPDIDVQLTYDAISEQYTSTLSLTNVMTPDSGQYYCQITNDSGFPQNSNAADLLVYGLVAHWTLNQDRYADGNYLEETAALNAAVAGTPTFVPGADGAVNGAVQISATDGWAVCPVFNPVRQSGRMTVSFWADWSETAGTQEDIVAESNNDEILTMTNGLKADGQWQHVCTVFDGTTGKLYVDGMLRDAADWQLPQDTDASINIGIDSAQLNPFNGAIDDVRVYNYALSNYEVADLRYEFSEQGSCIPGYTDQYDVTGPDSVPDCRVDIHDLTALADDFLQSGSPCDLTGPAGVPDGIVDLYEMADLAATWLSCGLYPNCD